MMIPDRASVKPSRKQSYFAFAGFHFVSLLLVYSILRLILFFCFKPENPASGSDLLKVFAVGIHLDSFVGLVLTLPIFCWIWILPSRWLQARWHRILFCVGFFLFWVVQSFLLVTEFYFFDEFKSRFNTVAVDYLLYPHEVFINIQDSYPVGFVLSACVCFAAGWLLTAHYLFGRMWEHPISRRSSVGGVMGGFALSILVYLSISPKESRFTNERVLNEMANNGSIAFVTAAWTHHLDFAAFYRTIPIDEAHQRTKRLLTKPNVEFVANGSALQKHVAGDTNRPRLNVVILLIESFGSEFWGSLGRPGASLTPEMDNLAVEEGMLFTNLYASGNRTVRGLEGVLASFPPLPGDSIVKRDLSDNVETIARVLKRDGYATAFLYGGRGLFDGMRSFALNNGYDRFIEQKDFDQPTFSTIWGVCDEDLYRRAVEEFRSLAKTGQPFFSTVLSVSNHKPFTYPKGRIPEDPDKRQRDHAVKYTDFALGQFFKAVKTEPFYTNTIFAVVADHGARVYGSQSIPIHSYEIPLLIAGPAVVKNPSRVPQLGCSLDVAPTVLGLLGRPYESLFFGSDLLNTRPEDGRVLINHNRDIGLYRQERMVVFGLNKTVEFYQGDPKTKEIGRTSQPDAIDRELEKDATALFQAADDLYVSKRYRLDR